MRRFTWIIVFLALASPATAHAEPEISKGDEFRALKQRVVELEAQLDAQGEARTRQADAFDAATSRIEFVNYALVAVLALAGLGVGFLAIRWARELAEKQVTSQIETSVHETGKAIFEAEATALKNEYEDKFTELYRRYGRLAGDE